MGDVLGGDALRCRWCVSNRRADLRHGFPLQFAGAAVDGFRQAMLAETILRLAGVGTDAMAIHGVPAAFAGLHHAGVAILFHPDGTVEDKRGGALHTAMQALWELGLSHHADLFHGISKERVMCLDGGGGFCYCTHDHLLVSAKVLLVIERPRGATHTSRLIPTDYRLSRHTRRAAYP